MEATYAIFKYKGKQYQVKEGDTLNLENLGLKEGSPVIFEEVLLLSNGKTNTIGQPFIQDARVKAKVETSFKGEKLDVIKFKAKSRYFKKKGFRQKLTKIKIQKIETGEKEAKETPGAPKKRGRPRKENK